MPLFLLLALILALAAPAPARAADPPTAQEVRALQYALSRIRRYPPGPVDGIIGPRTRAAVSAYAGSRPLEDAFWTVAAHLETLVWWSGAWSAEAEAAAAAVLAPAAVPQRRADRMLWVGTDRRHAACVRLATRDGLRWLHIPLREVLVAPAPGKPARVTLSPAPPSPVPARTSDLWCALGYVP
jgi:hypothetical protein